MDVFQPSNAQLRPSQPKNLLVLSYAADADRQRMLYAQQEAYRNALMSFHEAASTFNQQDLAASCILLSIQASKHLTNPTTDHQQGHQTVHTISNHEPC
eukprot:m.51896 g.51896  ORF g.51896 m.51896 type:complete len:99 (+) comp13462_c0_seq3:108-404(+)